MKSLLSPVHHRIAKAILDFEQRKEPSFVSDLVTKLGYAAESSLTATLRIMERNGFLVIQGGGERGRARVVTIDSEGAVCAGGRWHSAFGNDPSWSFARSLRAS